MSSALSWVQSIAFAFSLCGLGAFGCSHEQKAPPEHPTAPVAAQVQPRQQPPEPPSEAPAPVADLEPAIYFDFDSYVLRPDTHSVLQKVAASMESRRTHHLEIDGNCDELGTTEYNLALGEERARAAKTYLKHLGVSEASMKTVSYGAERPKYSGHDDDAHAKNRRDDLIVH